MHAKETELGSCGGGNMGIRLSNNLKNAAKISSGTLIGQLISIAILPVITRIYGAEIMGIWTVIVSISGLMNTVTDLGLSQAMMIENPEEEIRTYNAIMTIVFLMSFAPLVIVALYCKVLAGYNWQLTIVVVLFSLIYALTLQINQVSYTWLNKKKNYSVLMKNPILNHGSMAVFAIALGLLGFKTYGYYIGVTIGQLITLVHMSRHLPRELRFSSIADMKAVIRKHQVFVKYQMPTNVTIQAREQFPNLLIGVFFGNTVLGYFSISQKLLNIPVTFIGQSLGKVFYQRLAELRQKGEQVASFIYRNFMRAMKLCFLPMILLAAFGDAAIVMFFGSEYDVGGVIVRIVVFRTFFTFISTCMQGMDIVLERQKYSMITCITQTILLVTSIALTHLLGGSIYVCALAMTVSFIVVQVVYFSAIFHTVGISPLKYLRNVVFALVGVLVLSFAVRAGYIWLTEFTGWAFFEYLASFLVT